MIRRRGGRSRHPRRRVGFGALARRARRRDSRETLSRSPVLFQTLFGRIRVRSVRVFARRRRSVVVSFTAGWTYRRSARARARREHEARRPVQEEAARAGRREVADPGRVRLRGACPVSPNPRRANIGTSNGRGTTAVQYRASVASRRWVNVFFVLFSPAPFAATERALTEEPPINAFVRWDARRSSRSWWASTR